MSAVPVTIPQTFLESFCRHNHIHRLSLFGSVLTPNRVEDDHAKPARFNGSLSPIDIEPITRQAIAFQATPKR